MKTKRKKARIKKGWVDIEIRSSMYDKDESLFISRKMSRNNFMNITEVLKEFDEFMVLEYGKWKIGRKEAKSFFRTNYTQLLTELEQRVEGDKAEEIDDSMNASDDPNYEAITNRGYNSALQKVLDIISEMKQ